MRLSLLDFGQWWLVCLIGHSKIWQQVVLFQKVKVLVAQSCPILCDPMDGSPQCSSVHGILQARILEWVAIPFFRGSSWPRDRTQVSCVAGKLFTIWATREAHTVSVLSVLLSSQTPFLKYKYVYTLPILEGTAYILRSLEHYFEDCVWAGQALVLGLWRLWEWWWGWRFKETIILSRKGMRRWDNFPETSSHLQPNLSCLLHLQLFWLVPERLSI